MGFQDQLSLNAGQKYCRMLQGEHSAVLSTCIMLPHGFKTFVLSFFEWRLKTGFTVVAAESVFGFRLVVNHSEPAANLLKILWGAAAERLATNC